MIVIGRDVCGQLPVASRLEWLETNGLGGYAQGTVAGLHTRSYHALLVAPQTPPLHRLILLSQLEETLTCHGQSFALSANEYRDTVTPKGYLNLEEFRLDPFPVFIYRLADLLLEKRVFMTHGHNLIWIAYRLLTNPTEACHLSVRPQLNFRQLHLRKRERRFINTHHDLAEHVIRLIPDGQLPTLNLYHNAEAFEHSAMWIQNLYYREEDERGLDCEEDLFSPGAFTFTLGPGQTAFVAATTDNLDAPDVEKAAAAEIERRRALVSGLPETDSFGRHLTLAADQFLVRRGEGMSVIAGYPWLGDCGRDALIALPGLTLATRRFAEARAVLTTLTGACEQGLLPNYYSEETAQPAYNSVDASLWLFWVLQHYLRATGDTAFVRKRLWATLHEIVDYYIKGTRHRIRMDDDGLINIPEEGAQYTWMEAQVGDWVVTPRSGKPVEVNALWYNALCCMRDWSAELKEPRDAERFGTLAEKVRASFAHLFWYEKGGYLFDRVEDNFRDPTLRPNQLVALAVPNALIDAERGRQALAVVRRELYTTFGFRTLTRSNPHYAGTYQGDLISREGASFQGTVWPWLIGMYADALRNVSGATPAVAQELRQLIMPFESHLHQFGLGGISEMFDGDPPHTARGCVSRAWGVGEILRVHLDLLKA